MSGRGLQFEDAQDDECLALLRDAGVEIPAAVANCRPREGLTIDYASPSSRGSSDAEEAHADRWRGTGLLIPAGSRTRYLRSRKFDLVNYELFEFSNWG